MLSLNEVSSLVCNYWMCTWEFQAWVFHCWRYVTNLSFEGDNFGLLFQYKWIYSGIFRTVGPTSTEHTMQIHKQLTRPLSMEAIKPGSCLHSPNQSCARHSPESLSFTLFNVTTLLTVSSGHSHQTLISYSSLILLLVFSTPLWGVNSRDSYCVKGT